MDLSQPQKRPRSESIVPMINVVFLLLIFFLMTSNLAQPEPFEVTPPHADLGGEAKAEPVLFIDATGHMHFDGAEGEVIFALLALPAHESRTIQLRADSKLEAKQLAGILKQLAAVGLSRVELVVQPK
ncbi:outer membrane transport energization protein ExbD [Epibacterium ulvae]|uniref:Outer membrane transport energization protein ExbD n=1 Tax=Epibacterium ulvae TaxID=1156985 RepID=A0A1G5QS91_9RHOB|nr:biopolymer transporter ExbD [Epibacterium ulvae]SCZ64705.1 outer membrane transport energization protein ExbD [Epibacterium ulvae]